MFRKASSIAEWEKSVLLHIPAFPPRTSTSLQLDFGSKAWQNWDTLRFLLHRVPTFVYPLGAHAYKTRDMLMVYKS